MSQHSVYLHYLQDILENAEKAIQFVDGMNKDDFLRDEKTSFAVIRALEIIGEATKSIPEEVLKKYPHIPWRDIARMRDKLVHHYFGVDLITVWKTITEDLPFLCQNMKEIIKQESKVK